MSLRRERGFLAIVVLVMVVILAALAVALGFLVGQGTLSAGSRLGSMRAFFIAESGLEYEQRRWAQNLDWYRATSDPSPAAPAPQAMGGGNFTVLSTLAATLVRTQLVTGGTTLNVYTANRFPAAGILQIGDDVAGGAEFVRYGGTTANSFTGLVRGQAVGTVATAATTHPRSTAVYPVTILRTAMAADCNPMLSIQVDAHGKFLRAGTVVVDGEEIGYKDSSTVGGLMTLSGITRCLGAVAAVAHAVGQPVTPLLGGGQVELASTGVLGANTRYARRTVQR